jgi:ABC-type sugar transport system ATPase subunit
MLFDMVDQYDVQQIQFLRETREKIIQQLAIHHDQKKIISFLNKVGILNIDDHEKVVHVGVPNEFVLTQAKKFFAKAIKDAINEVYNPQYGVKFVLYTKFAQ